MCRSRGCGIFHRGFLCRKVKYGVARSKWSPAGSYPAGAGVGEPASLCAALDAQFHFFSGLVSLRKNATPAAGRLPVQPQDPKIRLYSPDCFLGELYELLHTSQCQGADHAASGLEKKIVFEGDL